MTSVTLHIPNIFGGIEFSDPQQFSELENFGPLGAGGGVHGEGYRAIGLLGEDTLNARQWFC